MLAFNARQNAEAAYEASAKPRGLAIDLPPAESPMKMMEPGEIPLSSRYRYALTKVSRCAGCVASPERAAPCEFRPRPEERRLTVFHAQEGQVQPSLCGRSHPLLHVLEIHLRFTSRISPPVSVQGNALGIAALASRFPRRKFFRAWYQVRLEASICYPPRACHRHWSDR